MIVCQPVTKHSTVNVGHLAKDIKGDHVEPKWTIERSAITTPTVMARGVLRAADLLTQRYMYRWYFLLSCRMTFHVTIMYKQQQSTIKSKHN